MTKHPASSSKQSGAVLITSLVLLLVLTIIGATLFSTGTIQEKMASNNELISLQFSAAQSAVDAYISQGSVMSGGLLVDPNNGNNIIVRTMAATPIFPAPFIPIPGNAVNSCVDRNGVNVDGISCAATNFQNTTTQAPIKAQTKAYYEDCHANYCDQAQSIGTGAPACPRFYIQGSSWLDADNNGLPANDGSEPLVYVDEWLIVDQPIICSN